MGLGYGQVYTVELLTNTGSLICDISKLCQNRQYILTRNDAEQLTFDLDLTEFETYCEGIGVDPTGLLAPYKTDVKVKRNGTDLFIVQIVDLAFHCASRSTGANPEVGSYSLTPSNNLGYTTMQETITVTCTGYLNIFADRYITYDYTGYDPTHVAADLLYRTQQLTTNGDVGVVVPADFGYLTGTTISDLILVRQQVKNQMQTLAELSASPFDFSIDATKTFHTYAMVGDQRNDVPLIYGGPDSTIIQLSHQRTAAGSMYNEIIGEGSGSGTVQLSATADNTQSQLTYFLRQKLEWYSHVRNQTTLQTYVDADLARLSSLLEMPTVVVNGSLFNNAPFPSIGDRFPLYFPTHKMFSNINGQYFRIEQMTVKIDDNDYEYSIALTFDNYGLQIEV